MRRDTLEFTLGGKDASIESPVAGKSIEDPTGILAQWRRGMLARGLAAALLLAVPVTVAAAIGFGNSFSGIGGGLSAIANGPATTSTTTTTAASPRRLDDAVVALAGPRPGGGAGGGSGVGGGADGRGDLGGGNTGGGGSGGGGSGGGGSSGGGSSTQPSGGGDVPGVTLPSGGGESGGSGDPVVGVITGLNDTSSLLLGGSGTP
jgi:hypothetical protein